MPNTDRKALIRNKIADYLKVGETFELMGTGFKSVDESPSAQTDSTTYINETGSSTDIVSYETEFSYEADHIPSQKAITGKTGAIIILGATHSTSIFGLIFITRSALPAILRQSIRLVSSRLRTRFPITRATAERRYPYQEPFTR